MTKTTTILCLLTLIVLSSAHPSHAFYDYKTGRWLNQDPLGIESKHVGTSCRYYTPNQYPFFVNLYEYAISNPVNNIDPYGNMPLSCWVCLGSIVAKFGGGAAGCLIGCAETDVPDLSTTDCFVQCMGEFISPCELLRQFKNNPAEGIAAAICVKCGLDLLSGLSNQIDDCSDGGGCEGGNCPPEDYFPGGDIEEDWDWWDEPDNSDDPYHWYGDNPEDECSLVCGKVHYYPYEGGLEPCFLTSKTSKWPCWCRYSCLFSGRTQEETHYPYYDK